MAVMKLDTYLKFNGNCREAFEFYRQSFGGEFAAIQTFGDAPDDVVVGAEHRDLLMHVSLPVGTSVLMGSDSIEGFGPPTVFGSNFSITVHAQSKEEADDIFAKLAAGGSVEMPMQEMFWGAYFGALTDQFGVAWQIHHDLPRA